MNAQDIRNLSEAYMNVYQQLDELTPATPRNIERLVTKREKDARKAEDRTGHKFTPEYKKYFRTLKLGKVRSKFDRPASRSVEPASTNEETDLYDIILSHLLDEGYAETPEAAEAIMVNMSEDWREDIMEKEDSEYEKASDAALDSRYGYGRASGDKRSFGRAANRSSAAAALRAIRRGERSGSETSTEAGSDAVHQGWARTAKTSADQTPEKKERRAGLANTPYSKLPEDEKEKDRVSFNAVRAIYNRNRNKKP